jgi:hypothetical protein
MFAVTVSARRFAPYVWLRLNDHPGDDAPGGEWSDNFLHLRPGQSRRLTLTPQPPTQSIEDALSRLTVRTL